MPLLRLHLGNPPLRLGQQPGVEHHCVADRTALSVSQFVANGCSPLVTSD